MKKKKLKKKEKKKKNQSRPEADKFHSIQKGFETIIWVLSAHKHTSKRLKIHTLRRGRVINLHTKHTLVALAGAFNKLIKFTRAHAQMPRKRHKKWGISKGVKKVRREDPPPHRPQQQRSERGRGGGTKSPACCSLCCGGFFLLLTFFTSLKYLTVRQIYFDSAFRKTVGEDNLFEINDPIEHLKKEKHTHNHITYRNRQLKKLTRIQ